MALDRNRSARFRYLARCRWEEEFGEIPVGCVIHHRDLNPFNNDIYNLECLTIEEHKDMHYYCGKKHHREKKACEMCGETFLAPNSRSRLCVNCRNRVFHSSKVRARWNKIKNKT